MSAGDSMGRRAIAAPPLVRWLLEWKLVHGDRTLLASERGDVVRYVILNHWYHHRGQLPVYLGVLDVPLPAIYGDRPHRPCFPPVRAI